MDTTVLETVTPALFVGGLVAFFLFIMVDGWWFRRPSARRWRGVPVWRGRVAPELLEPLRTVGDQLDGDFGWVRRDGHVLVLHANPGCMPRDAMSFRTSWPFVAVVSLRTGSITYQQPLGTTLFALPHLVVFFPFMVGLYAWNTSRQTRAVRALLTELSDEVILRAA